MLWMSLVAPAHALDCAYGLYQLYPQDGAIDVPTNVVPVALYYGGPDPDALRLSTADGAEVPAEAVVRGTTAIELVPDGDLLEGAYVFGTEGSPVVFAVGSGPDTQEPRPPRDLTLTQTHDESGEWGPVHALYATWRPSDADLYQVRVVDSSGAVLQTVWTAESTAALGLTECGGEELPWDSLTVEVIGRDLAGNTSEPAAATTYFGESDGTWECGTTYCSTGPGRPAFAALALLLFAARLRGRARTAARG